MSERTQTSSRETEAAFGSVGAPGCSLTRFTVALHAAENFFVGGGSVRRPLRSRVGRRSSFLQIPSAPAIRL
jgi:hypothetical protein